MLTAVMADGVCDWQYRRCERCGGVGLLTPEQVEWEREGTRHYLARIQRQENLRDASLRYGCTPVELSSAERGERPLPEAARVPA